MMQVDYFSGIGGIPRGGGRSNSRVSSTTLPESLVSGQSDDTLNTYGATSLKLIVSRINPFDRTLSQVESFEHMKRAHKIPDYHLKIVVVGDGAVGKTSLLISYVEKVFKHENIPTIFENYVTNIQGPKGQIIELALWDTAGQEEYSRLRPLSYTGADVLMICYAIDSITSLKNVEDVWFPEVRHFCPGTPVMLVGLKSDLYEEESCDSKVDPAEADSIAKKNGAFAHIQCSAKLRVKVDNVFYTAINELLAEQLISQNHNAPILKSIFKLKKLKLSEPIDIEEQYYDGENGGDDNDGSSSGNVAALPSTIVKKNIRKSKCIVM